MMFVISVIVIGSLFFTGKGWSQTPGDAEAEKICLQKRASASETANPSELDADDFLNIVNEAFSKDGDSQRSKRTSFSTNPDDLKPLMGTTWIIAYKIGDSFFTDALTFGTQVDKSSDGTVGLIASNQYNKTGGVIYGDILQSLGLGGKGFSVVFKGTSYTDLYTINANYRPSQMN